MNLSRLQSPLLKNDFTTNDCFPSPSPPNSTLPRSQRKPSPRPGSVISQSSSSTTKLAARSSARRRSLSANSLEDMTRGSPSVRKNSSLEDDTGEDTTVPITSPLLVEPTRTLAHQSTRSLSPFRPIAPIVITSNNDRDNTPAKFIQNSKYTKQNKNKTNTTNKIKRLSKDDSVGTSLTKFDRCLSVMLMSHLEQFDATSSSSESSSSESKSTLEDSMMDTIVKQNTRVNDSIKKAMFDQLMLIFSSIKKIELAAEKQSDGRSTSSYNKRNIVATAAVQQSSLCTESIERNDVDTQRCIRNLDYEPSSVEKLLEMYQKQRILVLSVGITPDEIMVSALAIMKKICGGTIKNVPQNLPRHNPFTEITFATALLNWQNEACGVDCGLDPSCGYCVNEQLYISNNLFLLPAKKKTLLPSFLKKKKSLKWKPIRILLEQKKIKVWNGTSTDDMMLDDTMLECKRKPMFVIEMHRKLVLTPLKVYENCGEEKYSLSLMETDELRKNLAHQEEGKDQEILRIGCIHPGQYHFFQIALQVILDSFHSDSED